MNAQQKYWNQCQKLLRERTSADIYQRWLAPLRVEWQGNRVSVIAANRWAVRQIQDDYGHLIEDVVREVTANQHLLVTFKHSRDLRQPPALRVEYDEHTKTTAKAPRLEKDYTFDRFLTGTTKSAEKAAAIDVAESFESDLATVVIYGTTGLGKSHLLHAIGHHVVSRFPEKNIKLTHSTTFVNDITSILGARGPRKGSVSDEMMALQREYLRHDVILLDDLHRLVGKDKTQDEFLQLVDQWQTRGTKLVFASLGTTDELTELNPSLRSRLLGGLSIQAMEPDPSVKVQILLHQASREDYDLPEDVAEYLAEQLPSDIRVLKGTLMSIARAQPVLAGRRQRLTREAVDETLTSRNLKRQAVTADRILTEVGKYFGVTVADIQSSTRVRSKLIPRQIGMKLAHELTTLPMTEIALAFGRKDHSTVKHALDTLPAKMSKNPDLRQDYERLANVLKKQ